MEEGAAQFKIFLMELKYVTNTACICIGKPSEEIKPLVNLWLQEGVSHDSDQVDAYLKTFYQSTDTEFSPVTVLISHFIEKLSMGFIRVDTYDIIALAKKNCKMSYLGVGTSLRDDVVQSAQIAGRFLKQHPSF